MKFTGIVATLAVVAPILASATSVAAGQGRRRLPATLGRGGGGGTGGSSAAAPARRGNSAGGGTGRGRGRGRGRRSVRNTVARYIDNEGRILQDDEDDPLDQGPSVTAAAPGGDFVDVAIIGGGPAGLYAGWRLLTATDRVLRDTVSPLILTAEGEDVDNNRIGNLSVAIYEMTNRVGGSLLSVTPVVLGGGDDEGEMTTMDEGRMLQHDFGNFVAEFGKTHVPSDPTLLSSYVTNALDVEMEPATMIDQDKDDGGLAHLRGGHVRNADLSGRSQDLYRLKFLEQDKTPQEILASAVKMVVGPRAHTLNETQWRMVKERQKFRGEYLYNLGLWNVLSDVLSGEAFRLCLDALGSDSLVGHDGGTGMGQNAAEGLHRLARGLHHGNNGHNETGTMDGGGYLLTPSEGMEDIALALRDEFLEAGGSIQFGHRLARLGAAPGVGEEGEGGDEEGEGGGDDSPEARRRLQDEGDGDGEGGDDVTTTDGNTTGVVDVVPHTLYDLHFANGNVVRARHVILALPKRALQMLIRDDAASHEREGGDEDGDGDGDGDEDENVTLSFFHGNETAAVPDLIDSVSEVPSFKLFLCYPYAWWHEAGVGGGGSGGGGAASQHSSTTDQPLRRTVYYGGDHGEEGGGGACILASYADGWSTQPYWGSTEPLGAKEPPPTMIRPPVVEGGEGGEDGGNETRGRRRMMATTTTATTTRLGFFDDDDSSPAPTTRWGQLRAPPRMVQSAQKHLLEMHNLGYIPHPLTASYVNWAREPSHSGSDGHVWNAGVKSWEVLDAIRRPLPDWNVYVIGEAYSNHQRSIEGDFDTAEEVLSTYFFAPPDPGTWTASSGSDILGEDAGFDLGQIVSVSSNGRRMALTSNPPGEPQGEEEDSPSDGRRRRLQSEEGGGDAGQVQVYDYVGTDGVGMWVLAGSGIETMSIISGGLQYAATLSGDGKRLVIGTISGNTDGANSGYFQAFEYRGQSNWTELGDVIEVVELTRFEDPPALTLDETGTTLAVGVPEYLDGSGRVHVFRFEQEQDGSSSTWAPLGGEIDGAEGNSLGASVSLSRDGNVLAVGAPQDEDASGFVAVFQLINDLWETHGQGVSGAEPGEEFGLSVSLSESGDHLAVGAPGVGPGRAIVYHYNVDDGGDDIWEEYGTVQGDEEGDLAGFAVDLAANGTILAVGMPFFDREDPDDPSTGRARVFRVSPDDVDRQPEQIGTDITGDGTPGDVTGYTVSASSDGMHVIVGIPSLTAGGQVRAFSFIPDLEEGMQGNETDANSTDVTDVGGNETDVGGNETDTGTGTGTSDTIADVVGGNEELEQLSAYLERAGLIDELSREGPFTLFAPTNDAFDDLTAFDAPDGGVSADLLNDPGSLAEVLLYHVVAGELQMGEIEPGQEQVTLQGSNLVFDVDSITQSVTVNDGIEVESPGDIASNGVIYLIDSVLIPPNLSGGPQGPPGPPDTNDTDSTPLEPGPSPPSPGETPSPTVLGPPTVPDDGTLAPTVEGEGDGTPAPTTPNEGSSEPSSVGDGVPPPVTNRTLMEVFDDPDLSFFKVALETAELDDEFGGDEPLTVFAPTNAAFTELVNTPGGAQLIDNPEQLSRVLRYHVVPGELLSTDLTEGQEETTLEGGDVVLGLDPVSVNDVEIVNADIRASNGVVHAIDSVLVPDEETLTRRLRTL